MKRQFFRNVQMPDEQMDDGHESLGEFQLHPKETPRLAGQQRDRLSLSHRKECEASQPL